MITLQSEQAGSQFGAAPRHAMGIPPLQRLVAWRNRRRNHSVTGLMDPRLLEDAGLAPTDAVLAAASTSSRHILWGIGVRRTVPGLG